MAKGTRLFGAEQTKERIVGSHMHHARSQCQCTCPVRSAKTARQKLVPYVHHRSLSVTAPAKDHVPTQPHPPEKKKTKTKTKKKPPRGTTRTEVDLQFPQMVTATGQNLGTYALLSPAQCPPPSLLGRRSLCIGAGRGCGVRRHRAASRRWAAGTVCV